MCNTMEPRWKPCNGKSAAQQHWKSGWTKNRIVNINVLVGYLHFSSNPTTTRSCSTPSLYLHSRCMDRHTKGAKEQAKNLILQRTSVISYNTSTCTRSLWKASDKTKNYKSKTAIFDLSFSHPIKIKWTGRNDHAANAFKRLATIRVHVCVWLRVEIFSLI